METISFEQSLFFYNKGITAKKYYKKQGKKIIITIQKTKYPALDRYELISLLPDVIMTSTLSYDLILGEHTSSYSNDHDLISFQDENELTRLYKLYVYLYEEGFLK